ncbi:MAG: acetate--CoA ligase family protein [Betaproteobacteria bacterium]|nr:acetate--CoA ligase family protein [Betaproteobacteria bacterium]
MAAANNANDITPLMAPRSVALVGATDHLTSFGGRVYQQMMGFGFKGNIYPINPRLADIRGVKCYPNIKDLPEVPDHVGIVVSAERVFDVLTECGEKGVKFATVFSGGFNEIGTLEGRERQQRLLEHGRNYGIRFMGPNCNGIVNFVDRFAMTSTAAVKGQYAAPGDIGVVSHSGGLGQITVMWRAMEHGLGISYEASCGNEADIDTLDFARFMLRSETTNVVLLAIEGIKSGDKFRALAHEAAELEKPLVILKLGATEVGSRAAASHTGAIAADNDIVNAVCKQYGLIRVNECNELYETAVFLRKRRWPKGRGLAAVAPTGGNVVNLADAGAIFDLQWNAFTNDTQAALAKLMPGYGKVGNPTDLTSAATGNQEFYRTALMTIAADPGVDVMIPIVPSPSRANLLQTVEIMNHCGKETAMLWIGGCTDDNNYRARDLIREGVAVYRDATPCTRAIRAAYDFGQYVQARKSGKLTPERPAGIDQAATEQLLKTFGKKITEREAKLVLACYGLPVTQEVLAKTDDEAVSHAAKIGGKLVLKIDSPDIAHKTEAGGVKLGVEGKVAIAEAFETIIKSAKTYAPNAQINGVLVQEMARPGVELMLGVIRDPVFGPIVAVGLGGIFVEVLKDIAYRAAPVTPLQANEMLDELRGKKLLEGVRGTAARDRDAVVDAIVRLSWFAADFRDDVAELDINPLMVYRAGEGLRVLDALIVRAQ